MKNIVFAVSVLLCSFVLWLPGGISAAPSRPGALSAEDAARAEDCYDDFWRDRVAPYSANGARLLDAREDIWRYFLWEPIPAQWFTDEEGSKIVTAYQQRNWEPFFLTLDFKLNSAAEEVLTQVRDGVDEPPRHVDYAEKEFLDKTAEELARARERLENLKPDLLEALRLYAGEKPLELCELLGALDLSDLKGPDTKGKKAVEEILRRIDEAYVELFDTGARFDVALAALLVQSVDTFGPAACDVRDRIIACPGFPEEPFALPEPLLPEIQALKGAGKYYRELAHSVERIEVQPEKRLLEAGDEGDAVARLQKRLIQEGFYSGPVTGTYDESTARAVKEFQHRHALKVDGIFGPNTRRWMNVSFEEKVNLIEYSMEQLGRSDTRRMERFVRVNIPEYRLEYFKNAKLQISHRVIVGKSTGPNHTPVLTSEIERLVFNPRWCVTERIRGELEDDIQKDPDYLRTRGFIELSTKYPSGDPRICQLPGPKNPLGQVKFEFPNPYLVYLHDTSSPQLFELVSRDLSHGCIRMEGAVEFAERLLEDDGNGAAAKLDRYLKRNKPIYVTLNDPVAIVIEYVPVFTDEGGKVIFGGDPYDLIGVSG